MDSSGRVVGLGMELLNQSNYNVWKTCMESYLVGEDLWDVVGGDDITALENNEENAKAFKQWRQKNAKAEFALKRSISHGMFEHIICYKSANGILQTLDRLFNKRDVSQLQFSENQLANDCQPISEARMKRHIVHGLKPEYIAYVTSLQGWAQQPSLEESKNLLSSQESLAEQMASLSMTYQDGGVDNKNVHVAKKRKNFNSKEKKDGAESRVGASNSSNFKKKNFRCYRCGGDKQGSSQSNEEDWGKCFMARIASNPTLIDFKNDWIIDSGCGHHVTGDASKFSSLHLYKGKDAIIITDNTVHSVEKEGTIILGGCKENFITLNNVYHVPELKADVVHVGRRIDDVYVLSTSTSFVEKLSGHDNASIRHAHLGHLNMNKLRVMAHRLSFEKSSSRFTWVYFVKDKSEVFLKFQEFKETVERALGRKIKQLRTDNGEGMKCVAYVISRVPLSPTNMKSSYELMFGEKHNVRRFKIFGSIYYVHVPDSQRNKFDAEARKCIFVGYDEQKKGWKCRDPISHKFVVSRNVVFDEISSYYGSTKDLELEVTSLPFTSNSNSFASQEKHGERGSSSSSANGPSDDEIPLCFEKATGVKVWEDAMDEEMNALFKNETWDLVPKPKDVQLVSCKWVYKIKRKVDGSIDRYKARLVAHGFSQKYGEDYEETFSPVAKMTSVCTILALVASQNWKLWQLDVKNAFLYGELDKDIYMEQPPGYVANSHPDFVCKLKKALYGLKQAPRAWYGKIAQYLQFCGYLASDSDHSLFVKKQSSLHVIVLLYVDDMIIIGNDEEEIARLQEELSIRFDMKNLGELNHFLDLEVENLENGIFITQRNYAEKLVAKFGLKEGKKHSTSLDINTKLRRDEGSLLSNPQPYHALVGNLISLTITRPNIAFSVGLVSRFMQSPRKPHLEAVKKILKYVNTTLDMGLFYKKGANFSLLGFTDVDFGGALDNRKSTSGYVWDWLIEDLDSPIQGSTSLYGDNQSAIRLATNPVCHARTKHIEVEHHFIREKVLEGTISALEVKS
ncbi:hypothetical protein SLEP1_g44695 [Rubroshorea leprosula]|uniref:Uncharacterized protein n=1 Tax=Rubroshorea leprosula TaxID=152421 RepID=A0AAV5LJ43_9ROSI|nr:hypothetical protein SLEP1_g44695 [Rubroshorea leprosula]